MGVLSSDSEQDIRETVDVFTFIGLIMQIMKVDEPISAQEVSHPLLHGSRPSRDLQVLEDDS